MPNPDPRRELATLDTCDTYLEHGFCNCWPRCEPSRELDEPSVCLAAIERRVDELREAVAGIDDERLATLPELERRLITETRAHLAEYDRAKRGEGG
jgi:hypothetical protein